MINDQCQCACQEDFEIRYIDRDMSSGVDPRVRTRGGHIELRFFPLQYA